MWICCSCVRLNRCRNKNSRLSKPLSFHSLTTTSCMSLAPTWRRPSRCSNAETTSLTTNPASSTIRTVSTSCRTHENRFLPTPASRPPRCRRRSPADLSSIRSRHRQVYGRAPDVVLRHSSIAYQQPTYLSMVRHLVTLPYKRDLFRLQRGAITPGYRFYALPLYRS